MCCDHRVAVPYEAYPVIYTSGDAVDVFKDGCWWTGRVCECYDDHITVMFPSQY